MKKLTLLITGIIINVLFVYNAHAAQPPIQTVEIISSTTAIQFLQAATDQPSVTGRIVSFEVEYYSTSDNGNTNQAVNFAISATAAASANPAIASNTITINANEFSTKHRTMKVYLLVNIHAEADFVPDQTFYIGKTGFTLANTFVTVNIQKNAITNPHVYKSDDEAWFEAGANVDLVDGGKIGNLAAGVFCHLKNKKVFGSKDNFSMLAGVYETKTFSVIETDTYNYKQYITPGSFSIGKPDSVKLYGYFSTDKTIKTIRNWSVFASPQIRLTNGKLDDGKIHLLLGLWFEFQRQDISISSSMSSVQFADSSNFTQYSNVSNYKRFDSTTHTVERGISTHYIGIGLPVYYQSKIFQFTVNPYVGASNQPKPSEFAASFDGQPCWRPFYVVQFRLNENYAGITFTGEVRGLMVKNSPAFYTMAITKKFSVSKILQLLQKD